MNIAILPSAKDRSVNLLTALTLSQASGDRLESCIAPLIEGMRREEFDDMVALASSNHVIVRGLHALSQCLAEQGAHPLAAWTDEALHKERLRIANAVQHLHTICAAFEEEGLDVTVIKSLDHWPDMGSDLDLYTNAPPTIVLEMMHRRFGAKPMERSWGDRLACKWNVSIPGLPESIELHIGRLGQTGEQVAFARQIPVRAQIKKIAEQAFRVPCPVDRVLISTLQRMYRHFYFRLSDIVNSSLLMRSGELDYQELRFTAEAAGIWKGAAAYLKIVSDYVQLHGGAPLNLPEAVMKQADFGGSHTSFHRGFLRVPIIPHSARLYRAQLGELLRKREFQSSARLGLLPWLATAAAMGQKLTGSDKGIW